MNKSAAGILWVVFGLIMATGPLYAHHAMSLFDQKKVISVTGKITEFNWENPHATLLLDANDSQGSVEKWVIEFGPPAQLHRDNGLNSDSLKPGDKITIDGHPYKDGRKIMRPTKVVMPNGQEITNLY